MGPRNKRKPRPKRTPGPLVDDIGHPLDQTVAEFTGSLVHGEAVDQGQRARLVPLAPDPPPEVAAEHPEIAEMMRLAPELLFIETGLSALEQEIVLRWLRKASFSPFNALMELLARIPRAQLEIDELVQRGIPRRDLVAALVMTPEELQAKAAPHLVRSRAQIGRHIGRLRNYPLLGEKLKVDPRIVEQIREAVSSRIEVLELLQAAIERFVKATGRLTRQTKSPLVREARNRVARLLIHHSFAQAEAFKKTAALLRAWNPKRFRGLNDSHVRSTFNAARRAEKRKGRKKVEKTTGI